VTYKCLGNELFVINPEIWAYPPNYLIWERPGRAMAVS
jgi:hypothetical protein